jgi:protein-tyrosine-phosphatase
MSDLKNYSFTNIKATAGRLLPHPMAQEVRQYITCKWRERLLYLKLRLSTVVGLENPKRFLPPKTARSYLFVCFGNIIRSPMCEALMNRALGDSFNRRVNVFSAGLNATPGTTAHPWAIAAAREFGISLENHRSRLLTAEMVEQADAIFVMDYQNLVQLLARYSQSNHKVFMLSAYGGEGYHPVEIRDPYYAGEEETRNCYKILNTCIANLVCSLYVGIFDSSQEAVEF